MFRTIFSPWRSPSVLARQRPARASLRRARCRIFEFDVAEFRHHGLFLRFNRSGTVRVAVRFFDVLPPFQPRVGLQRISLRNPHARLARDRVLAAGNGDERPAFQRRRVR